MRFKKALPLTEIPIINTNKSPYRYLSTDIEDKAIFTQDKNRYLKFISQFREPIQNSFWFVSYKRLCDFSTHSTIYIFHDEYLKLSDEVFHTIHKKYLDVKLI